MIDLETPINPNGNTANIEAFGLSGIIITTLSYCLYIIWSLVPKWILIYIGIPYSLNKYWAISVPTFILVTLVWICAMNSAIALTNTPSLDSMKLIPSFNYSDPIIDSGRRVLPYMGIYTIQRANQIMYRRPK